MTQPTSALSIKDLNLFVSLGYTDQERAEKQTVLMDIDLCFATVPTACVSDQLTDTLCYGELIQTLKNHIEHKSYHLIEHLTYDAYQHLKPLLPVGSRLHIRLLKHPPIAGLNGGVVFHYGDQAL